MPTDKDFCRYEDCGFLLTDPRHFRSHVSRSDWPRWMFAKGGKPGMTDKELDLIGAPKMRQRQIITPPVEIAVDPKITAPVSLMCGLDGCDYTTPFTSKNHDAALRMHRLNSRVHKQAVTA